MQFRQDTSNIDFRNRIGVGTLIQYGPIDFMLIVAKNGYRIGLMNMKTFKVLDVAVPVQNQDWITETEMKSLIKDTEIVEYECHNPIEDLGKILDQY